MKLLHDSDWHFGCALHGCKRYEEYDAFLNWLAALIENEDFDALKKLRKIGPHIGLTRAMHLG